MQSILIILITIAFSAAPVEAQLWSGILDPSRAVNWSNSGVTGGIPNRTSICQTLNPGATATVINAAIQACASGQVVFLTAGTYTIGAPGIIFSRSNVTLRGAGPDATQLVFTGSTGCGGLGASICVWNGESQYGQNPHNTANWISNYSKGSTSIVLDNKTGLAVGGLLTIDQLKDGPTSDTGDIWMCNQNPCVLANPGQEISRPGRMQSQVVTVTSISGSGPYTVGISPGVYMPNYRSHQAPGAWWPTTLPLSGVGIEDLSIDGSSTQNFGLITFYNATQSWVKNLRIVNAQKKHVMMTFSNHISIRDSYFFKTQNSRQESYGVDTYIASDVLVENNIFQHMASGMILENGHGVVWGYNYSINNCYGCYTESWMQANSDAHAAGNAYILWEGNDGATIANDHFHGPAFFVTMFRNREEGYEPNKAQMTLPIIIGTHSRYANIIGNVLGRAGYHIAYDSTPANFTTVGNCYKSIYVLGMGGNCGWGTTASDDPLTAASAMRWGNYDTVNNTVKFELSEVPSGLSKYANQIPASQTLPPSFYLISKPSFFGSQPWPPIGPDVTGGALSSGTGIAAALGGHANRIPARICFEDVMRGSYTDETPRTFNASVCYGSTGTVDITPPIAPTGLRIL